MAHRRINEKTVPGITRRQFVQWASVAGIAGLGGCCNLPKPALTNVPFDIPHSVPPLAIKHPLGTAWMCFDTHTHFINARDAQIEGFVRESVAHGMESDGMKKLTIKAASILQAVGTSVAPDAQTEIAFLRQVAGFQPKPTRILENGMPTLVAQHMDKHRKKIIDAFATEAEKAHLQENTKENPSFKQLLFRLSYGGGERRIQEGLEPTPERLIPSHLVRDGMSEAVLPITGVAEEMRIQGGAQINPQVAGLFRFIFAMLSYRYHNVVRYMDAYSTSKGAYGIDACMAAPLDFNYWLGCPDNDTAMLDQVLLHEELAIISGGYVLPLVPYNPWTDAITKGTAQEGASLRLVEDAVTKHGAVGVKIYPPNGFYPYGNEALGLEPDLNTGDLPPRLKRPSPEELDSVLEQLFKKCAELEVPVMAHTYKSLGAGEENDNKGGPCGWQALLENRNIDRPIINLAHFGGDEDATGTDCLEGSNWTEKFVSLMNQPNSERVYGDIAYWMEFANGEEEAVGRLMNVLDKNVSNGQKVKDRVMYGTDWHMMIKEEGWEKYAWNVLGKIARKDKETLNKIAYVNAMHCYGLGKAGSSACGQNRVRLEQFYHRHGVSPEWIQRLDNL